MRQSLDSHLLECPICLEQLRQPKSLPCLHSFCLECLGSYITKELSGKMASASSFSCPVCRKVTEPLNQSEGKESWAEQFPTNNLAVEIIQHIQKTDKSITCKPCEKKGNLNNQAKFWCKLNNTYFCSTCKINIHDLLHEECECQDISEVNISVVLHQKASVNGCGKHEEKMEYYCEDDQILGCSKCIILDHRKCELVTSAEDYRDKLRKSSKIDDLLEELRKSADAMEILIKDVGEQLQSMTMDQDTALQSLTDIRKKIDERFDVLQKDLTENIVKSFKEEKESLEISKQKCERLMFSIQNTLTSSEDAALKDDTVGTICLFQRGQAEVESCKELIQELESSTSTSIKHEYDSDILAVDINTSLTMGKIVVDQQPRRLPSTVYSNIVPLSERQLKTRENFTIKIASDKNDCRAVGVVFLPGGRIVVGDHGNRKMKLFTEKGDLKFELELTDAFCDLCRIDDNTVAVILIGVKTICIVNVGDSTLTVSSKIKIPKPNEACLGVAYHNNYFTVGTTKSIYSVPASGGEPKQLLTIGSKCLHLASNQKNGHVFASICTSTPDEVVVTRLSDGTHTDILKVGVVEGTTGIDLDRQGNVYVCGSSSNNIIQMSGDGSNVRELMTSSDGIKRPRAISVWEDRIVITNGSEDQRNFVHLFQLV
ncbi:E3 ubiquitin-protein ligase Midline-1-like [Mizuhopecten yessoensis]|uniref:Tripartite motif-containing protein 2 n=1 Tax=Mizuhopecten yessoensis TaxID=6573 RepID=A0A210QJP9_MIZYE|nr:E3 ubiquitin-protein ligase Midline-1-like [Mizuhopecten yessoensis]OWF48973.1 Tripartite motif-containing protein 2 [Mizuhopecten yessoensis]